MNKSRYKVSINSGGKKQQLDLKRKNILTDKYSDSIFCTIRV